MQFDTADLAAMQANGTLLGVIMHEMGHVLGIGTLWSSKGLLVGANTGNPQYVGQQGLAAYRAIAGASATGVPIENTGGSGTRIAHWRESVFGSELMTGFVGPGSNMPLSRVTVGALADLGYSVNYAAADPFTLPGGSTSAIVSASSTSTTNAASFIEPQVQPQLQQQLAAADPGDETNWPSAVDYFFAEELFGDDLPDLVLMPKA
jgi:hypothetical protein